MAALTQYQRQTIVRLFQLGSATAELAVSYEVSISKIEQIIREALKAQEAACQDSK